jgi:cytochrome b
MEEAGAATRYRTAVPVWDRTIRCFHWVNALCVLLLAVFGLAILNASTFGVSDEGKLLLKTLHVYVGYVFAVNLLWRLVWGFLGGHYARWRAVLPFGRGYGGELRNYIRGMRRHEPLTYLGHNPLGRLMIGCLLLLLLAQAVTGLILAGTDLYKPPFGNAIATWVTGNDPGRRGKLKPGSKDFVDAAAYDDMRRYRKPVITVHLYAFYLLMLAVVVHTIGVVVAEVLEKNGLLSAMFSGRKMLSGPPVDARDTGGCTRRDTNER